MTILERLESNPRRALVECPKCKIVKEMDYHKVKSRPLLTDVCQACTVSARNQSEAVTQKNYKRIDELVAERNKPSNNVYIIKFTDQRKRCLVRCNLCNTEYESTYSSAIFTLKGCLPCVRKFPKRVYEHSEYYTPRLASIYNTLVQRVTNPNRTTAKKYYQDKHITICNEWLTNREAFFKWSHENGYTEALTIDRISSDGNYEPSNCRWVTKTIQARNTVRLRSTNTSGYRGVSSASKYTWRARIRVNNTEVLIGIFDTALEAALAYDNYVLTHNLEHTRNFTT